MPDSKRLGDPPGDAEGLRANLTGVRWREELLRGTREQLEEDVVGWIAELAAATATMRGTSREGQLSGAIERLDRLEEALRHAPDRLQEQLRERLGEEQGKARRGLDELFDHAPIGMALIDMNRCRVHVNDALCRLTGYSRNQLIGVAVQTITYADDVDLDAEDRRRLLAGEISAYQIEKRYVHAWGHHV